MLSFTYGVLSFKDAVLPFIDGVLSFTDAVFSFTDDVLSWASPRLCPGGGKKWIKDLPMWAQIRAPGR